MKMRNCALLIILATMLLLSSACVHHDSFKYETEDAVFLVGNGLIEVVARRNLYGLDIYLEAEVEPEDVDTQTPLKVVVPYEKGTVIAIAEGRNGFKKGETIARIAGDFTSPADLGIVTESVLKNTEFVSQSSAPVDGVYIQDTWVQPEGAGFFIIGARNVLDEPIAGFDLVVGFDNSTIEITAVTSLKPGLTEIQSAFTDTNAKGKLELALAYARNSELTIGAMPVNLYKVCYNVKTGITYANSEISFDSAEFTWLDSSQSWLPIKETVDATSGFITVGDPVLLGDFDLNDTVNVQDLPLFAEHYREIYDVGTDPENPLSFFDIGPATRFYGDSWANIFSKASRDGNIDIVDLVVLAQNYYFSRPANHTTFVKNINELNAAIEGDADLIVLGANITGSPSVIERIVDLNLNGYKLTGDLSVDIPAGISGDMTIFDGTIEGSFNFTGPDVTLFNYATIIP